MTAGRSYMQKKERCTIRALWKFGRRLDRDGLHDLQAGTVVLRPRVFLDT